MYKAICFSRVSSEHQDLVQQSDEVLDEAMRYGFKKEECIFIEYKESAIKLDEEERAGLNDLKYNIKHYETITTVFVYELSRISRKAKVVYSIRDFLLERNIQLVCIKPHFELLDRKTGKMSELALMVFGVFVGLAESEMTLKKARMRRGVNKKRELGMHAGGQVMFGYNTVRTENGCKYVIDVAQGTIVKRIFNEYVYGNKSMRTLACELQEEGNFKGIKYLTCVQEIYNILHRDCYCGRRNGMPPIISEDLYEKSVKKRKDSELKVNHTSNMALCKGILRDGNTGLLLSSNTAANMYYSKREKGVAVGMHIIEPVIWDIAIRLHKEYNSMDVEQILNMLTRRRQMNERKWHNMKDSIKEAKQKIDKIEERLIMGKISEQKADELEAQINNEINHYNQRIKEIEADNDEISREGNEIYKKANIEFDYDNMTKEQKYDVVHNVIDKVILSRESRYMLNCMIYNKLDDNVKQVRIDTYKKIITYI